MNSFESDPELSVIIPAYNAEEYVVETLESVLRSEDVDPEIIVVDDGSTDATATVVTEWSARSGKEVVLIRQQNSGLSMARNVGIASARGRFVSLLDSDDLFLSDHLSSAVSALRSQPQAILAFDDVQRFDDNGNYREPLVARRSAVLDRGDDVGQGLVLVPGRDMFTSLLAGCWIAPSSWTLRRLDLLRTGMFAPGMELCEDRELLLRLARIGPFIARRRVGVRKRVHDRQITSPENIGRFGEYSVRALMATLASATQDEISPIREVLLSESRSWLQGSARQGVGSLFSCRARIRELGGPTPISLRMLARAVRESLRSGRRD